MNEQYDALLEREPRLSLALDELERLATRLPATVSPSPSPSPSPNPTPNPHPNLNPNPNLNPSPNPNLTLV